MKLPIITDQHFGCRNDSQIFNDFFFKFYENSFFPTLKSLKSEHLLNLGDLMDRRKYCNFNTLQSVNHKFMDTLLENKIHMTLTVGNHDDYYKSTNSLNSPKELFGNYSNLSVLEWPTEYVFGNTKFLLLPWITQENEEETLRALKMSDAKIVAGHLAINGFEMSRGSHCVDGLEASLFDRFEMVLSGHFHHKSNQGNIWYLGSPYGMTFNDYGDPRGFHILDTDTLELEFIENPYKMFFKIYYDDKGKNSTQILREFNFESYTDRYVKLIIQNKNPKVFDKFMDRLHEVNPANISVVEEIGINEDGEEEVNIESEDTLTILSRYVDTLEIEDNAKISIKDHMRVLYIEANQMETDRE